MPGPGQVHVLVRCCAILYEDMPGHCGTKAHLLQKADHCRSESVMDRFAVFAAGLDLAFVLFFVD